MYALVCCAVVGAAAYLFLYTVQRWCAGSRWLCSLAVLASFSSGVLCCGVPAGWSVLTSFCWRWCRWVLTSFSFCGAVYAVCTLCVRCVYAVCTLCVRCVAVVGHTSFSPLSLSLSLGVVCFCAGGVCSGVCSVCAPVVGGRCLPLFVCLFLFAAGYGSLYGSLYGSVVLAFL